MRNLVLLSLVFVSQLAIAYQHKPVWNPDWFTCAEHSECMMARGACEPLPVNKKYREVFEAYSQEPSTRVDCNYNRPDVVLFPACFENRCVADPQVPSDQN